MGCNAVHEHTKGRSVDMSAYSDWKYGLITDSEYNYFCRQEEYMDRYYDEHPEYLEDDEEDEYDIYFD